MKTYIVWLREECHHEYHIKADNAEDAKQKVIDCTYDADNSGYLNNTYYETWGDGDQIFEVEEMEDDNSSEYPFDRGDTYYILDGDEWVECIWDIVSEVIHGAFPNKEYYREPNKESKV